MQEQENMQVKEQDNTAVVNDVDVKEEPKTETTFTQEQVNDFVRERLNKFENGLFKKYGVENRDGLNELFEKAKSYETLSGDLEAQKECVKKLTEENAFLKNKINPNKYEDIRAYFKGKDLEFSEENLINELATHNEWLGVEETPKTTIKSVGADQNINAPRVDEKEIASKLFGLSKII